MDDKLEELRHYHDMGEGAITRGLENYKHMIFPDAGGSWLEEKPKEMRPDNPMQWSLKHYHLLGHFSPKKTTEDSLSVDRDSSVQYQWDWKERGIFGGFDGFFSSGSLVLDLGSGKGVAAREINERFGNVGVKCVGVDYRY